jgi:transposase
VAQVRSSGTCALELRRAFPSIKLSWADCVYAGKLVTWAPSAIKLTVHIVKRPADLHTFQVLPRHWVVESTFAWITKAPPDRSRLRLASVISSSARRDG